MGDRLIALSILLAITAVGAACTAVPGDSSQPPRGTASPERAVPTTAPSTPTSRTTPEREPSATPPPTEQPAAPTAKATETPRRQITITVVYDNNAYLPRLETAWGFACLVETPSETVLFDTGGDGVLLLRNMAKLGVDPNAIDVIVLSHIHGDHVDGLATLLDTGIKPAVYVPAAFPASFKNRLKTRTKLIKVSEPVEILPGVRTTGEIGSAIVEQALVVDTAEGLVVITGCAHPGIVRMVARAVGPGEGQVALVLGGFHLGGASDAQIEAIISDFRGLGVQQLAPCHCTGAFARQLFSDAYGDDCFLAGAGWALVFVAPRATG
jgi:7,8-dihydropterin-6-yl-methyl-4-(beta-D-ribofuranosyl)aminobenzene 5'-phosphate synthase